ncbi:putative late blight resistance protein homolog R1A-3 [Actinidia eriantha]|uniref:putative late blight resistance protein homolog R1A-3 n=1 Tax=Actinidia eriantha TaxID=165200 RepID=UPI0025843587|nr:putative late blight resistance protein homolog R1A-3 [Actinidia eriantha]
MELIGRSLVLVFKRRYDGGVKACGIHDLLRDFCIKQAEKERFLQQIYRELPILYLDQPEDLVVEDSPSTLITSSFGSAIDSGCTKSELADLDFPWWEVRTSDGMFSSYKKLVHFTYLEIDTRRRSVSFSNIHIPTTISNLGNLETLIIHTWTSVTLPHCIRKMVTLRHLHLSGNSGTMRIEKPGAIYPFSLDNLQTLSGIDAWSCRDFLVGTPNIRKLGIRGCIVKNGLVTIPDTDFLNHLQELKLWGQFCIWPIRLGRVRFPTNLKKLTLMESRVKWNEISTLGKSLPNLEVQKLLQCECVENVGKQVMGTFLNSNS